MWEILNLRLQSVLIHGHDIEGGGGDFDVDNDHDEQLGQAETDDDDNDDDDNGYDEDENLVPGTLGPGGGGVNQAMQAATASKMSRMHTCNCI